MMPLKRLFLSIGLCLSTATSIPGPIGVKGVLINAYVDQDLRIVTGNSVSGTDLSLFILERADAIVP